jgi:predicted transcriptional regulator
MQLGMNQATNEKLAQPLATFTLRVPEDLWRTVRILALDRKCSAQEIWTQAMEEFLERNQQ